MQSSVSLSSKVLLNCQEFSTLTGLSLRTVAKLIASCEVKSIRVGRRRLIPRTELDSFITRDHRVTVESTAALRRKRRPRPLKNRKTSKRTKTSHKKHRVRSNRGNFQKHVRTVKRTSRIQRKPKPLKNRQTSKKTKTSYKKHLRVRSNRKNSRKHIRTVKRTGHTQRIPKRVTEPRIARALGIMRREGSSASEAAPREGLKLKTFVRGATNTLLSPSKRQKEQRPDAWTLQQGSFVPSYLLSPCAFDRRR